MTADPIGDLGMFDIETPPPITLADRFGFVPMSILDRRSGEWQTRKRQWLSVGFESEVGRDEGLTYAKAGGTDPVSQKLRDMKGGTSIFDPVLCELVYRWYSRPGARVLDPFSGGSVRGLTASTLARWYIGVDIRPEQVDANRNQLHLGSDIAPMWLTGDATDLASTINPLDEFDLVFSCPPYADLEVYSDDPRDISTWDYPRFIEGHTKAITDAVRYLRDDRYACWVIGDVRDPKGAYRGLVHDTVRAFQAAGLHYLNEFVLVDPVGTASIRAARPHIATRKATKVHQQLLVFVKGDIKRAATYANGDD